MEKYQQTSFAKDVQKLVQIPSVSGNETAAQQHLHGKLQAFGTTLPESSGFSTWLQPVEPYISPNLISHKKGNNGLGSKKAVILTGHIDTVSPAGQENQWTGSSPWSGEIVEKSNDQHALHGLGASDMKMGLTVLQYVFEQLVKIPDLDCDVWFVSTVNEEKNGAGTKAFAEWFQEQGLVGQYPQGIATVFGEPRNLGSKKTIIGNGNKANDFLVAQKSVGSHHSSEEGSNVVVDIAQLVQGLEVLNSVWKNQPVEEGFTPIHISPTKLDTPNDNLNSTPATGSLSMDLRSTPLTQATSLEQVVALATSLGFDVAHAENPAPGSYTSPESPLVKAFQSVLMQNGVEVSLATTPGSTDAGFLQAIRISENLIVGAGLEEQEHHVDEYAILEEGERAIGLTVQALLKWIEMQGASQGNLSEKASYHPELLKVFGAEQPKIGMVHLPQLPGYHGQEVPPEAVESLIQQGKKNLHILSQSGFTSVAIENHGDNPPPDPMHPMPHVAKESFLVILQALKKEADTLGVKLGLNLVYDMEAAMELAYTVKLDFLRLDIFADPIWNEQRDITISNPPAAILAKQRAYLEEKYGHHLFLLVDVQPKHFIMLDKQKTLEASIYDAEGFGADAVIITGSWTGVEVNNEDIIKARKCANFPVFVGSGVTQSTVAQTLEQADGVIVGTSIKMNADYYEYDIDPQKAEAFIQEANK